MKRIYWKVDAGAGALVVVTAWEVWRQGWGISRWLPVLAAILLHEAAHVAAAKLCGIGVKGVRLGMTGARLELDGLLSYGDEWFIAVAGPMTNLLSAALVFPMWQLMGERGADGALIFALSSLALGMFNLLPISTLDGGRMLYCALARWKGMELATAAVRRVGRVLLWGWWLVTGYGLLRTGGMLSLWVFATCLLCNRHE